MSLSLRIDPRVKDTLGMGEDILGTEVCVTLVTNEWVL